MRSNIKNRKRTGFMSALCILLAAVLASPVVVYADDEYGADYYADQNSEYTDDYSWYEADFGQPQDDNGYYGYDEDYYMNEPDPSAAEYQEWGDVQSDDFPDASSDAQDIYYPQQTDYDAAADAQAPDGEYYVLAFDDNGEETRFDFFKAQEGQNLIREVRVIGDEEYETFYQANAKDLDEDDTTTGIVAEWCAAIVSGGEDD